MRIFLSGELQIDEQNARQFVEIIKDIKQKVQKLLDDNNYGDSIKVLAIIPSILPIKDYKKIKWKERKIYRPKNGETDFRLFIDAGEFAVASYDEKERMIINNVLTSIKILTTKVKEGFEGHRLEKDIKDLFGIE